MDLLKLKVAKNKELVLLGDYEEAKVYQVLKRGTFKKNFYKSYFVVKKDKKLKRIYSNDKKIQLAKHFSNTLTYIALGLINNVDIINYIGIVNGFYLWEAWVENSLEDDHSIFIFYDYSNYVVVRDRKKIDEIRSFLPKQEEE